MYAGFVYMSTECWYTCTYMKVDLQYFRTPMICEEEWRMHPEEGSWYSSTVLYEYMQAFVLHWT